MSDEPLYPISNEPETAESKQVLLYQSNEQAIRLFEEMIREVEQLRLQSLTIDPWIDVQIAIANLQLRLAECLLWVEWKDGRSERPLTNKDGGAHPIATVRRVERALRSDEATQDT
jgi:hypothetical protein